MTDKSTRIIVPWLLLFVYFPFVYNYGLKLNSAAMPFSDLPSFYAAARISFNEHRSPYDLDALAKGAKTIDRPGATPYLYPPPSLLAFYPFAKMSFAMAKIAITAVSQLCVIGLVYVLLVRILNFQVSEIFGQLAPAALVIYILLSRGITFTMEEGQVNLIVALCLCIAWAGLSRNSPGWMIGLALAAAIIMKTYPAVMVPLLLLRRRYSAFGWMMAALAAATATAYAVLPHAVWGDWYGRVIATAGYAKTPYGLFSPSHGANQSINGFVSRLFLENGAGLRVHPNIAAAQAFGYAMAMMILGSTLYVCYQSARREESAATMDGGGDLRGNHRTLRRVRAIDLEFSLFLIVSFLIAPLSWEHHLAFVAPACVVALAVLMRKALETVDSGPSFARAVHIIVLLAIFMIAWPFRAAAIPMPYPFSLIASSAKFCAVVILWLFMLREARST